MIYFEGILHDNTVQIFSNNVSTEEIRMLAVIQIMNTTQNFNVEGLLEVLTRLNIKLPVISLDDYFNGRIVEPPK